VDERVEINLGSTTVDLVLVPPGWVKVADRIIELPQPLLVSVTELTEGQWAALFGKRATHRSNLPKTDINWYQARDACRKFSEQLSHQIRRPLGPCRLPKPEEWIYLATGGESGPDVWYADPEKIDAMTWYVANSSGEVKPVGAPKSPNGWNLYNILGNVQEWCSAPAAESDESPTRPVCGVAYSQPLPLVANPERLLLECGESHPADSAKHTVGMRIVVEIRNP